MGLAMALATTFMFSEGIKSLFGKPKPDLLARCQLDPATVERFTVGQGFGSALPEWNVLVSWTACTQTDEGILANGFRSFPSGHAACRFSPALALDSCLFGDGLLMVGDV